MTNSPNAEHEPAEPLLDLLSRCVVRIDVDGSFGGTGFLFAPAEVLTCAHVVHGGSSVTVTTANGVRCSADVSTPMLAADDAEARHFYPLPDTAVLRLSGAPEAHPCVHLDTAIPATATKPDVLRLDAFTIGEHARETVVHSGAALEVETLFTEDAWTLYKLRGGQVIGGFSGGPLLNLRTGSVCAFVDSSRGENNALGGFGIPIAAALHVDPGLLERNRAFHETDARWRTAQRDQSRRAAERAGEWERLPLVEPVVDLGWQPDDPPSELLRPRHAVVPFVSRGDLLDHVMRWRESDDALRVLVLTGAGGFGKTRAAVEICLAAERAGWTAGFLAHTSEADGATGLASWQGRLLVAIDYAETRPNVVTDLLWRLGRRRGRPACRVVLVIRQGNGRQELSDLFASGDARDDVARLMRRAEFVGLGHGERELDRRDLFAAAAGSFAFLIGQPVAVPDLRAEHFERPLFVLASALLAVTDPELDVGILTSDELMTEILKRHEARYWQLWDTRFSIGLLPEDHRLAVALAVLMGTSPTDEAENVVRMVPSLRDAPTERIRAVARWLRSLYGGTALEPDLLAEVLVAQEIAAFPSLVEAVLDCASGPQLARVLLVLSRVSGRSESVGNAVRAALDGRLSALIIKIGRDDQGGVSALRLAIAAVQPVMGAIVAQRDLVKQGSSTSQLTVEIGELAIGGLRLLAAAKGEIRYVHALAAALGVHSITLSEVGRPFEALPHCENAIKLFQVLTKADLEHSVDSLGKLAFALNNRASLLDDVGQPDEALKSIDESVVRYRQLVQLGFSRFESDLARALSNQSLLLASSRRPTAGLAAADEAVSIYRNLAQSGLDLALALSKQANCLVDVGRAREAQAPIGEAVSICRHLAEGGRHDTLLPLMEALNNQSNHISEIGRPDLAIRPAEEAVSICREIVETDTIKYLPIFATLLMTHARCLGEAGRPREGLAGMEHCVLIRRKLAERNPARYQSELAAALVNQSTLLGIAGQQNSSIPPIDEAVWLYSGLAENQSGRFLPELAAALIGQSNQLSEVGRSVDGLPSAETAVRIGRNLVNDDPVRYSPDLARWLVGYSNRLAETKRIDESLDRLDEAIRLFRDIDSTSQEMYRPELATALSNQSVRLYASGEASRALDSAVESVAIRRLLVREDPVRFQPDLASAINNQSLALISLGRREDALALIEEAVRIRVDLARGDPERFISDLANLVRNKAMLLDELDQAEQAAKTFEDILKEYTEPDRSRAALLLTSAHWLRGRGVIANATLAAYEAVAISTAVGDQNQLAKARWLMRALRWDNRSEVDNFWIEAGEILPVWLQFSDLDASTAQPTAQLILNWTGAENWIESFEFLTAHASDLLTDAGEASIEQLIDTSPGSTPMRQHLAILQAARKYGVEPIRAEFLEGLRVERLTERLREWVGTATWNASAIHMNDHADEILTDEAEELLVEIVGRQPELLYSLGLLSLAREIGIEQAHALVADSATRRTTTANPLALARLTAGVEVSSSEAQFAHALTALEIGAVSEAVWAMVRCRRTSASWERASFARRLDDAATTATSSHTERVRAALTDEDE